MSRGAICNITRGCGRRTGGGVYGECGVGKDGLPLEEFIICPPVLLDPRLGVSPRGVSLIPFQKPDGTTVYHVADWIGESNYTNVWDFLAEARRFGVSRRFPKSLNFSLLTTESRILCVHRRAAILNPEVYSGRDLARFQRFPQNAPDYDAGNPIQGGGYLCPKQNPEHRAELSNGFPAPCCAGIWGQDVEGGEPLTAEDRHNYGAVVEQIYSEDRCFYDWQDTRLVIRRMPSFTYVARRAPDAVEPVYHAAFFASFPLTRLVVVSGDGDAEAMDKASRANLPAEYVKE
jgi:hypothetical protein